MISAYSALMVQIKRAPEDEPSARPTAVRTIDVVARMEVALLIVAIAAAALLVSSGDFGATDASKRAADIAVAALGAIFAAIVAVRLLAVSGPRCCVSARNVRAIAAAQLALVVPVVLPDGVFATLLCLPLGLVVVGATCRQSTYRYATQVVPGAAGRVPWWLTTRPAPGEATRERLASFVVVAMGAGCAVVAAVLVADAVRGAPPPLRGAPDYGAGAVAAGWMTFAVGVVMALALAGVLGPRAARTVRLGGMQTLRPPARWTAITLGVVGGFLVGIFVVAVLLAAVFYGDQSDPTTTLVFFIIWAASTGLGIWGADRRVRTFYARNPGYVPPTYPVPGVPGYPAAGAWPGQQYPTAQPYPTAQYPAAPPYPMPTVHYSPDGRYIWDGRAWHPAPHTPLVPLSPDGRQWWDGATWRPVPAEPAPIQPAPAQTPQSPPQDSGASPVG